MAVPDQQGSDIKIDSFGQSSGARGVNGDSLASAVKPFERSLDSIIKKLEKINDLVKKTGSGVAGAFGGAGQKQSKTSMPAAGTVVAQSTGGWGPPTTPPGVSGTPQAAGGAGAGGGQNPSLTARQQFAMNFAAGTTQMVGDRNARGAQYSLQADRMSTQYMQMYGMSNAEVRNQVRMPLAQHYLLGGGAAVNQLMGLQAATGLSAVGQASSVEAIRAISGFSYGAGDVTNMLGAMASPDVANRMFMMGGTGMFGIGGTQRGGMQVIQDIIQKTGLTNEMALKGALSPGSVTRQRLTAMGVPADMQDMVIQYAMQNVEFGKKGGSGMYDPSKEANRKIMGIEGTYAVQHEKTTGEMLKREESFYGRQTDNLADFEKNMRSTVRMLAAFEDALSGITGLLMSVKGHPVGRMLGSTFNMGMGGNPIAGDGFSMKDIGDATSVKTGNTVGPAKGGVPTDGGDYASKTPISQHNMDKLTQLDHRLAGPVIRMLRDNPRLKIGSTRRSPADQEKLFKSRYRARPDLKEKQKREDRVWNGVVWEHIPGTGAALAAPGSSWHEKGLAVDIHGDLEWIKANASKYGLFHGGTGQGGPSDEPWHLQPLFTKSASARDEFTTGQDGIASSPGAGTSGTTLAGPGGSPGTLSGGGGAAVEGGSGGGAGSRASELISSGVYSSMNSIMSGIDKPYKSSSSSSQEGDGTMIAGSSGSVAGGGGGTVITIAPNIYLTTTGDSAVDMRRMAQEIGTILEQEVRLVAMRSS
jgi:hypothetical protein